MTTLSMRLAGPLQSWGSRDLFQARSTRLAPTKSGVVGLLSAAVGRDRSDDVSDLASLRFGTRSDVPGRLWRDFQTARVHGADNPELSEKAYLADAAFLVCVEGPSALLEQLAQALLTPVYPLCLGRRACTPDGPIQAGLHEADLDTVLHTHPWIKHIEGRAPRQTLRVSFARDALPGETAFEVWPDQPVTFDPMRLRQKRSRRVVTGLVDIPGVEATPAKPVMSRPARARKAPRVSAHDPLALLMEVV